MVFPAPHNVAQLFEEVRHGATNPKPAGSDRSEIVPRLAEVHVLQRDLTGRAPVVYRRPHL